jgi:hypothetical protein
LKIGIWYLHELERSDMIFKSTPILRVVGRFEMTRGWVGRDRPERGLFTKHREGK